MKLNTLEVYGIAVPIQGGKAGNSVLDFTGAFEFLESWNSVEGMENMEKKRTKTFGFRFSETP